MSAEGGAAVPLPLHPRFANASVGLFRDQEGAEGCQGAGGGLQVCVYAHVRGYWGPGMRGWSEMGFGVMVMTCTWGYSMFI